MTRVPSMSALVVAALAAAAGPGRAEDIPAFARKYRTSCSTCHTAAPKLNVMGEAFRLNAYRFPENEQLIRREDPVPLGEDPWKDLWPRAIWPGELPGSPPLAVRIESDLTVARDSLDAYRTTFRFPNEVYLLAGASLGEHIGAFVETAWTQEDGLEVEQAKVKFLSVLPGVRSRLVNVWVGLQKLYLLTLGDHVLDGATVQPFRWQEFSTAEVEPVMPGGGLVSGNALHLAASQPAIEVNGLVTPRLLYGVGVAQGGGNAVVDNNAAKDVYYKLRYKIGGLRLDGTYAPGGGPVLGGRGQLLDRSLTLEHFAYFGTEPGGAGESDRHRRLGLSARLLYGRLDVGGGYVWARDDAPWGSAYGSLDWSSVFGRGEVLLYPWLIASVKAEVFRVSPTASGGLAVTPYDQTRLLPGIVALIRHNVRLVLEGDLYGRHAASAARGAPRPHALGARLDVAF